jgi:hypothetical protein
VATMFLLIPLLLKFYFADAACPNFCNLHGRCDSDNVCNCFDGYSGSDCSQGLLNSLTHPEPFCKLFFSSYLPNWNSLGL